MSKKLKLQYGGNTPYVSKYQMDKVAPLGNPSPLSTMIESSVNNKISKVAVPHKPNLIKGVSIKIGNALKGGVQALSGGVQAGVQALDKVVNSKGFNQFSQLAGTLNNAIPTMDKTVNDTDAAVGEVRNSVNSSLMQGVAGPWGQALGLTSMITGKLGGNTDASEGLGAGNDTLNAVSSFIPGVGFFTGRTQKYTMSDQLKESTGYSGVQNDATKAQKNAGAKLLFGSGKANRLISEARMDDRAVSGVLDASKQAYNRQAELSGLLQMRNTINNQGGMVYGSYGKDGLRFPTKEELLEVRKILANKPQKFEKGGKVNVIPDGALHARKHNIPGMEGQITPKGIPVILEEGGEITQQAEIEKEEIIFHKEVTLKLEELYKLGTDEAAIEAGKILTHEILHNTIDNTNILNTVE